MTISSIDSFEALQKHDLQSAISGSFQKALETSALVYTKPKEVEVIDDGPLTVELKILESQEEKPVSTDKQNNDPFLTPDQDLVIVEDLLEDFRLLLNKFPVSDNHFLLTTKAFKNQDDLISPKELMITYDILKNLNSAKNSNYFAFFNSGPESGFSQSHRHIQFMKYPLKNLKLFPEYTIKGKSFFIPKEGDETKQPLTDESMSFKHFILPLPDSFEDSEEKEEILSILYIELFKKILNFFRNLSKQRAEANGEILDNNLNVSSIPISYHLVMNHKFMMVIPRNVANYPSANIPINGTGFMGLLLARNEEQKDVILKDTADAILKECGFDNQLTFNKENEYDY